MPGIITFKRISQIQTKSALQTGTNVFSIVPPIRKDSEIWSLNSENFVLNINDFSRTTPPFVGRNNRPLKAIKLVEVSSNIDFGTVNVITGSFTVRNIGYVVEFGGVLITTSPSIRPKYTTAQTDTSVQIGYFDIEFSDESSTYFTSNTRQRFHVIFSKDINAFDPGYNFNMDSSLSFDILNLPPGGYLDTNFFEENLNITANGLAGGNPTDNLNFYLLKDLNNVSHVFIRSLSGKSCLYYKGELVPVGALLNMVIPKKSIDNGELRIIESEFDPADPMVIEVGFIDVRTGIRRLTSFTRLNLYYTAQSFSINCVRGGSVTIDFNTKVTPSMTPGTDSINTTTLPNYGYMQMVTTSNVYTYTNNGNLAVTDSFKYKVIDNGGNINNTPKESNEATVTINITNAQPSIVANNFSQQFGSREVSDVNPINQATLVGLTTSQVEINDFTNIVGIPGAVVTMYQNRKGFEVSMPSTTIQRTGTMTYSLRSTNGTNITSNTATITFILKTF